MNPTHKKILQLLHEVEVLVATLDPQPEPPGQLHKLIDAVAPVFGVTRAEVLSKRRLPEIVNARWTCWKIQHSKCLSLHQIGRLWGRDHATVKRGLEVLSIDRRNNSRLDGQVTRAEQFCQ